MKNLAENNLVRFINVTRRKDGLFANFKVKGIRGGMAFSASIQVDLSSCNIDPAQDSLEKIIEECAKIAIREFKKSEFSFEGLQSI